MTRKNGEDDKVVDAISTRTTSFAYFVVEKDYYNDLDRKEQSRSEKSSSTPYNNPSCNILL
jgi:hypothetical protein